MSARRYLVITALLCVLLYLTPLFASGFNSGSQAASLVLGQSPFTTSVSGTSANLISVPFVTVFDSSGNLWVADSNNNRVLEFTAPFTNGEAASLVLGQTSFTTSTVGVSPTSMNDPSGLAFDSAGNLWVADYGNNRVLEFLKGTGFTTDEAATLVLGQSSFTTATSGDTAVTFSHPEGIAFEPNGNLWVADQGNNRVIGFSKGSGFTTGEAAVAVLGQSSLTGSGTGDSNIRMNNPSEIAFDSAGDMWVADKTNNRVIEFTAPFTIGKAASLVLGQSSGFNNNGAGDTQTDLTNPQGIAFDSAGNLWVADEGNNRIMEFAKGSGFVGNQAATLVLGQSSYTTATSGDSANGLSSPTGVTFDTSGNLWVADDSNNRVSSSRRVPASATTSRPPWSSVRPGLRPWPRATSATGMNGPTMSAFDSHGDLWVVDSGNNRVVEFTAPFTVGEAASVELGQGGGFNNGGVGHTQNSMDGPIGIAFDSSGNLWVSDRGNNRILEFTAPFTTGETATIVLGQASFTTSTSGDNGNQLNAPNGITFDTAGNLWVADSSNNRVLEFAKGAGFTTGESAAIALGKTGFGANGGGSVSGDTSTTLSYPTTIAFDSAGNLWLADQGNQRILEFLKGTGFTTGEAATTLLGQTSYTASISGTSTVKLHGVFGIAFDSYGNLWVADETNNRVLEFLKGTGITTNEGATTVLGQTSFTASSSGTTSTTMSSPIGVTFDSAGNLWVSDLNNNRVLEFLGPTATNTVITCLNPGYTIDVGTTTTCTATVTAQSGSTSGSLSGETIQWAQGGVGSLSVASTPSCTLAGSPESCSVIFTGATAGSDTLDASYVEETRNNLPSSNTVALTINPEPGSVTVTPSTTTIDSGQTFSLMVSWTGGTPSYTVHVFSSTSSSCYSGSTADGAQGGVAGTTWTFNGNVTDLLHLLLRLGHR